MESRQDILDHFETKEKNLLSKKLLLLLLILSILIGMADLLIILINAEPKANTRSFIMDSKFHIAIFISCIHFVLVPIASFLISLVVSLIPMQQKQYASKYPSLAIVIMVLIQIYLLALTLLKK